MSPTDATRAAAEEVPGDSTLLELMGIAEQPPAEEKTTEGEIEGLTGSIASAAKVDGDQLVLLSKLTPLAGQVPTPCQATVVPCPTGERSFSRSGSGQPERSTRGVFSERVAFEVQCPTRGAHAAGTVDPMLFEFEAPPPKLILLPGYPRDSGGSPPQTLAATFNTYR